MIVKVGGGSFTDMEPRNMSESLQTSSPLSNCSVNTNYRFTFYQVSYSVIFLIGVATNSLALHRLCMSSSNMNSTAIYMMSLAAADLFFVISLPLRIYYYHQKARELSISTGAEAPWTPGSTYCQLTFTVKYISLYGGIFFLVCIAVDRYFAVVHPLGSTHRRLRVAQLVSAGMWCVVLVISLTLILLRSAAAHPNQPCLLDPTSRRHRTIILVALGLVMGVFLLPTVLLLYSYWRVLSVLRQLRRRSRNQRHNRRQHSLTIIYWVLGVFILCFVPYHLNLLGYTLTHVGLLPICSLAKMNKALHPVVLSLASSKCCLNPLIYYFSRSLVHREQAAGRGSGTH